jgi:hypothetical protein
MDWLPGVESSWAAGFDLYKTHEYHRHSPVSVAATVSKEKENGGGKMWKELMTMPHVILGVFGILFAVWVAVEAANACEANQCRLKLAGIGTTLFLWLSFLIGGWWYVVYYGLAASNSDKSIILAGPWKWSHTFFMEAKEHIFFMLILLSILLPIVIFRNPVFKDRKIRNLTIVIALMIVVLGLGMEGFGAMISKGVKMSLMGGK